MKRTRLISFAFALAAPAAVLLLLALASGPVQSATALTQISPGDAAARVTLNSTSVSTPTLYLSPDSQSVVINLPPKTQYKSAAILDIAQTDLLGAVYRVSFSGSWHGGGRNDCSQPWGADCAGAVPLWGNTGPFYSPGVQYCTTVLGFQAEGGGQWDTGDICGAVAPGATVDTPATHLTPTTAFGAVWFVEGNLPYDLPGMMTVYDVHWIYYGIPPTLTLPTTMTLSNSGNKNGVGGLDGVSDNRECPVTGCNGAQGTAGDPINSLTGGFDLSMADLSLSTLAGPLVFQRSYASPATGMYTQPLGYGWTHNQDTRLVFEAGQVQFKAHSANQYLFTDNGNGTYTPFPGVLALLTRNPGPPVTYVLTNSAQAVYTFDSAGRLLTWADALGHTFTYTYTAGRLSRVADSTGQRYLDLAYNPQGQLASVNDPTNRRVSFGYNAAGDLITATNVLSQSWRYTYDAAHRLTGIIDPNNVTVLRTDYDAQGRAYRQYDGLNNKTTEIAYTPSLSTTTLTDALGHVVTHTYNSRNLLASSEDAVGRTTRAYDANFRPGFVVDAKGNATRQTWSADGANLVQVTDAATNRTSMEYDARNHLTRLTDARGNATRYEYAGNLLITTTDALNGTVVNTYNPQNLLIRTVDHGVTTTFGYDGLGQRVAMTDTLGNVTRYEYDSVGRLITTTTPLGPPGAGGRQVTVNQFDKADRLIRVTANYTTAGGQNYLNEYNLVTQYGYDVAGRQIAITDTVGRITRNAYDNAGHLISTTVNYTTTSSQQNYLGQYNLITRYGYDKVGNQILVTDTLTRVTKTEYDAINRPVTVTVNFKDGVYNPAYPDEDLQTITVYDAVGNVTARRDATGIWTTFVYDALGRLLAQSDVFSDTTRYGYDAVGSRVVMTDANGVITRYGYDPLSRLTAVTESFTTTAGLNPNAYNVVTRYGYDSVGNRTQITNAKSQISTFAYDALNRLIRETDPLSNTARYQYDAVGNRTVMTDANNAVTQYAYDSLSRLRVITYTADATTVRYGYDVVGNRLAMTDSTGVTTYAYDKLNRPLTITSPLTGVVGYRYNALGSRTQLIYPSAGSGQSSQVITYTYDNANRLSSVIDWAGKTTQYAYDAAGRPLTTSLPNGITTTYGYDSAGRLVNLTHTGRWLLATYTYTLDAAGNRLAVTEYVLPPTPLNYLPVVLKDSTGGGAMMVPGAPSPAPAPFTSPLPTPAPQTFTSPLPPPSETTSNGASPSSPVLPDLSLLLLAPLLIVAVIHRKKGRRWSEPAATVLLAVTVVIIGMALSSGGAIPAVAVPAPMPFLSPPPPPPPGCTLPTAPITGTRVISYTYDPLGRLSQAAQSDGACYQYKYDKVGNRTALTTTAGVTTYGYDAANRLTSVGGQTYTWDNAGRLTNNGWFTYTYNTAGLLRMTQAQGITATQMYTYNGDGLLMAKNASRYVWDVAADLPQMLSDGNTLYVPGVGQWDGKDWTYELPDGLSSVRQLADSQGYLVQRYDYGPFGEMLASEGKRANSLRYTGEQWDNDVGLLYLRARWYDPATERFTTRDPFPGFAEFPQTQHPYVYAGNNPINLTDHSGKLFFIPVLIVAAAGGFLGGMIYYTAKSYLNRDPCAGMKWNWREAAFWSVTGTGLGAILGTGIYGGWWLGVQVGWWGTASSLTTGTYTVYRYMSDGVTRYVGMTNDFARRAGEHLSQRGWQIEPIPGLDRLSQADARAVEQVLIEHYRLDNLLNQINSIATTNPIYQSAIQRGTEILNKIGFLVN